MFKRFHDSYLMKRASAEALEALNGLGIQLLTNTDSNTFWYAEKGLETRYRQEEAKVGDRFWDGNNGDRHEVLATDLENYRIAVRNLDQNEDCIDIVCW